MKNPFIELVTMIVVLSRTFLRAAIIVAIAMGLLWLIGMIFPHVATSLGIPYETVYEAIATFFAGIRDLFSN